MDLEQRRDKELFEVKFTHDSYKVEIYFFVQKAQSKMLFTAGYFNMEAVVKLLLGIGSFSKNVSFIGTISGNNRETVDNCLKLAIKAVKRRYFVIQ